MRKLFVMILLALCLCGCSGSRQVIGTVEGPEWDTVIIDGVEYIDVDAVHPRYDIYTAADKGKQLGIIESGDDTLYVYALKGDEEGNYLYVRWEWEGNIYIRKDYVAE